MATCSAPLKQFLGTGTGATSAAGPNGTPRACWIAFKPMSFRRWAACRLRTSRRRWCLGGRARSRPGRRLRLHGGYANAYPSCLSTPLRWVLGRTTPPPSCEAQWRRWCKGDSRQSPIWPRPGPSWLPWRPYQPTRTTKLASRLLALTVVRPGELRGTRCGEFEGLHGAEPLWRVPAIRVKMKKEHLVPLLRPAVEVLAAIRPLTGRGALVFPSSRHAQFPMLQNPIGYF